MDARSIAATALNGGVLTGADELPEIPIDHAREPYRYDDSAYRSRVYYGVGRPDPDAELVFGPNIADWPEQVPLTEDLLLTVCAAIYDPVTTTDELIPSGETSSYRSNPLRLAEFALSRKDPQYVPRAKQILAEERRRRVGEPTEALLSYDPKRTGLGSLVMALRPGDGSAREQAASWPASAGRLRQHRPGICHQALPLQCGKLGHAALPLRRSAGKEPPARRPGLHSPVSARCWRATKRRSPPPCSRTARRPL